MLQTTKQKSIKVKAKRGFTLVELMAATALMMFLVAIVLSMTGNVMTAWNRAYSQLTANFSARQAMTIIINDLESTIIKAHAPGTLENEEISWMEIYTSESDDTSSDYGRFDHLFFFGRTGIRQKYYGNSGSDPEPIPGDVCAIAYRVAFINPLDPGDSNDKRFVLYRTVVDPLATFHNFLGDEQQESLDQTWRSGSYKESMIDETGERGYSDAGWEYASETMNLLALNIVALEIEPIYKIDRPGSDPTYVSERGEKEHIFPTRTADKVAFRTLDALEITMVVISNEGESIIRSLSNADMLTDKKFEEIAYIYDEKKGSYELGKYAEQFKKRVSILTSPF